MNIPPDMRFWIAEEVRAQLASYDLQSRTQAQVPSFSGPRVNAGDDDVSGHNAPWDVTFSGATATFTRCRLEAGPVTTALWDITYTITGSDGTIYLAAKWNTNTGAVEIIEGATLASVTDAEPPSDEYMKRLLYVVSKVTRGDSSVFVRIIEDGRANPMHVAYV